jgi:hypothetical protein
LFTESEVPITLVQNIKWLIPHVFSFELDDKSQKPVFDVILKAVESYPADKISAVMKVLDEKQDKKPGTYLAYLRHLLAQGAFTWDINAVNHRSMRTSHISPSEYWLKEEYEYVHAE